MQRATAQDVRSKKAQLESEIARFAYYLQRQVADTLYAIDRPRGSIPYEDVKMEYMDAVSRDIRQSVENIERNLVNMEHLIAPLIERSVRRLHGHVEMQQAAIAPPEITAAPAAPQTQTILAPPPAQPARAATRSANASSSASNRVRRLPRIPSPPPYPGEQSPIKYEATVSSYASQQPQIPMTGLTSRRTLLDEPDSPSPISRPSHQLRMSGSRQNKASLARARSVAIPSRTQTMGRGGNPSISADGNAFGVSNFNQRMRSVAPPGFKSSGPDGFGTQQRLRLPGAAQAQKQSDHTHFGSSNDSFHYLAEHLQQLISSLKFHGSVARSLVAVGTFRPDLPTSVAYDRVIHNLDLIIPKNVEETGESGAWTGAIKKYFATALFKHDLAAQYLKQMESPNYRRDLSQPDATKELNLCVRTMAEAKNFLDAVAQQQKQLGNAAFEGVFSNKDLSAAIDAVPLVVVDSHGFPLLSLERFEAAMNTSVPGSDVAPSIKRKRASQSVSSASPHIDSPYLEGNSQKRTKNTEETETTDDQISPGEDEERVAASTEIE